MPCCRRGNFTDESGVTTFASSFVSAWKATRRARKSTKTCPASAGRPASNTICRCFSAKPPPLFDYLGEHARLALHHDVLAAAEGFWHEIGLRYTPLRGDPARPLLPPGEVFIYPDALMAALKTHPRLELPADGEADASVVALPALAVTAAPTTRWPPCVSLSPVCRPRADRGGKPGPAGNPCNIFCRARPAPAAGG